MCHGMAATRDRDDLLPRPLAQYGLTCASSADKSFVFVKLTEQALLAIEQYIQNQVSPVLCQPSDPWLTVSFARTDFPPTLPSSRGCHRPKAQPRSRASSSRKMVAMA